MQSIEIGLVPNEGNKSETVTTSATSAQSTVLYTDKSGYVNIFSTLDAFMRSGVNPTAVNTGADQFIPAGNLIRVGPVPVNHKLAFITAAAGTVYITKES